MTGGQPGLELRGIALVMVELVIDVEHVELHRHVEDDVRVEAARQGVGPDEIAGLGLRRGGAKASQVHGGGCRG
jgi:hypothetical protein